MAWLDCTPEKAKTPRRTALQLKARAGAEVPELEPTPLDSSLEYLVGYLFEVGPSQGEHELTFGELAHWCQLTGVSLDDFESTALKQMSRAYLGMYHKARAPDCRCPAIAAPDLDDMTPEDAAQQRAKVAKGLGAWLGAVEESNSKRGMVKQKGK